MLYKTTIHFLNVILLTPLLPFIMHTITRVTANMLLCNTIYEGWFEVVMLLSMFHLYCDETLLSKLCRLQATTRVIHRQGIPLTFTITTCRTGYLEVGNDVIHSFCRLSYDRSVASSKQSSL
jgi:hypothetical protein